MKKSLVTAMDFKILLLKSKDFGRNLNSPAKLEDIQAIVVNI
jgi:hypothetical protein